LMEKLYPHREFTGDWFRLGPSLIRQCRQPVDRPFDIRFAATVDRLIQRLLKLKKCKFCGAVISQRDAICHRCGKAQV